MRFPARAREAVGRLKTFSRFLADASRGRRVSWGAACKARRPDGVRREAAVVFRSVAGLMAALLAFAAAVNVNDPDPLDGIRSEGMVALVEPFGSGAKVCRRNGLRRAWVAVP